LMREAVTMGHNGDASKVISITPDRFHAIYLHWIDNLRDWCISRQIWWGHRIPVWYCDDCKEVFYSDVNPVMCPKCRSKNIHQDEDTLDTWFSSGAWTFSTLGWPEETPDLLTYHPTNWMQMGYEILFFWMARMILMTTYALDDIPFKDVYIHGMLRDKDGRKFSKSLGNGLDPIDIIEKYGTDALRLSLLRGTTPGNDMRFYEEKVEGARNFVNKLWNISRFIIQSSENSRIVATQPEAKTLADKWILNKLNSVIALTTQEIDKYNFSGASEYLYDFSWNDFADWYLEISKVEGNKEEILFYVLQNILKLWHPFIPFVTEEIYQTLGAGKLLMIEKWPVASTSQDEASRAEMEIIKEIITVIRNLRSENKIEPAKMVSVVVIAGDRIKLLTEQSEIIKKLTRLEKFTILADGQKPANSVGAVVGGVQIYLELAGLIDVEAEKKRVEKEIAESEKYIKGLEVKLGNKEFLDNAPEEIIAKENEKLSSAIEKIKKLKDQLSSLV